MSIWSRLGEFVSKVSASSLSGVLEALAHGLHGRSGTAAPGGLLGRHDRPVGQDGEGRRHRHRHEVRPFTACSTCRGANSPTSSACSTLPSRTWPASRLCGAAVQPVRIGHGELRDAGGHPRRAVPHRRRGRFLHEREQAFLMRVAEIFDIDEAHFESIRRRHVDTGEEDPYRILGVTRSQSSRRSGAATVSNSWRTTTPTG
jgi:DnaJ like chaperone protein